MKARVDFDDSVLRARMASVMSRRRDGRTVALRVLVKRAVVYIIDHAARDTHRFVRAYQEAGNDLGVGPFVVDAIQPGRYEHNVRVLQNQLDYWQFRVDQMERAGRTQYKGVKKSGPNQTYLRYKKFRDRAAQSLAKLLEAGEGSGAIVIGGRKTAKGLSRLASVRTTVYGGRGVWIETDGQTLARIHNKEPHASIVNRNTYVVTNAMRAVRRYGGKRVSETYVREVAARTPWARRAA